PESLGRAMAESSPSKWSQEAARLQLLGTVLTAAGPLFLAVFYDWRAPPGLTAFWGWIAGTTLSITIILANRDATLRGDWFMWGGVIIMEMLIAMTITVTRGPWLNSINVPWAVGYLLGYSRAWLLPIEALTTLRASRLA